MSLPRALLRRVANRDLPLDALAALRELRAELAELEREHVDAARARGASWDDVARALGITRQAVQQRMRARDEEPR